MEKLISVIIPSYNVENLIDRCLESLEKQTIGIDNLEIILVDDASTDGTWNRILSFETKYPESVVAIRCEKNGRQGTARNIGIDYASADFVTYVDSDDWLEADMLEKLYCHMTEHEYDFVMTGYWRDDASSKPHISRKTGEGDRHFVIDTEEKRGTLIMCMSVGSTVWGKLYRKEFLLNNNLYFPEGFAYEDHFFMLLIYLYATDFLILDDRGYHYYINENSTVLTNGASHHYDVITIDDIAWTECEKRGYLEKYRKQLEVYFLLLAYLAPLKVISYRFAAPPYDFYQKLRESILSKIPNYKDNPYIRDYATEFNYSVLETLTVDINEEEFKTLCQLIKKRYDTY